MTHRALTVGICLTCVAMAIPATAQIVHVWDLADVDQPGQLTIYNPSPNDAELGTPIRSGDLNGDGFDDYIVSAMAADGPRESRDNAGEVAIYFSPGTFEGPVDLASGPDNVVASTDRQPARSAATLWARATSTATATWTSCRMACSATGRPTSAPAPARRTP